MGYDYIIRNILEVHFESGILNMTMDEAKCCFENSDSFEVNSDCSDFDSSEYLENKYLSTKSYKQLEIYNKTNGWKN